MNKVIGNVDEMRSARGGFANLKARLDMVDTYPTSAFGRQAVMNGNFEIAQRGNSLIVPNNNTWTYLIDRWRVLSYPDGGTYPTITYSRTTLGLGEVPGSTYCIRINFSDASTSAGPYHLSIASQCIEHGTRLLLGAGTTTFTLTFWARSNIAGKRLGVTQARYFGTGGSPTSAVRDWARGVTLTNAFQKYSLKFSIGSVTGATLGTNNDDCIELWFMYSWGATQAWASGFETAEPISGAGYVDIAQVQLTQSSVELPFLVKTNGEELRECQRYFEKSYNLNVAPGTASNNAGSLGWESSGSVYTGAEVQFKVRKRNSPSAINLYSPNTGAFGKIQNLSTGADLSGSADSPGETGFKLFVANVASSAGHVLRGHWTADSDFY